MAEGTHTRHFRERHLETGEEIKAAAPGYIGKMMGSGDDRQHNGELIVTNKRVIFYRKGFFGEVLETMPFDKITSVEQKSLMGHRTLRLHTSNDDLEFKSFKGEEYQEVAAAIQHGRATFEKQTSTAVKESPLETLKKLAELRAAGVVSEAEFEAKKRQLLDQV